MARLRRNHLAFILPAQFGDLDFRPMEEIESMGQWVSLRKRQGLFRHDGAADAAYLHVDRKGLQAILGAPDESAAAREILVNTRFPAWLSSEQGKHRIILLETDSHDPHWTESSISQADQVLTVGLAGASPALSDIEA